MAELGVDRIVELGHRDGGCDRVPRTRAAKGIARLIDTHRPDAVVTFARDGVTGHADHRAVAAWVALAVGASPDPPALIVTGSASSVTERAPWMLRVEAYLAGAVQQGHPVLGTAPGIEASTGSLGQGLSIALGMALAARMDKNSVRVFCLLGDGECQEGQVWETLMSAPKLGGPDHHLDNLCVILDYNRIQLDGFVKDILDLEPVTAKLQAFGWPVLEVNGHDIAQVDKASGTVRGLIPLGRDKTPAYDVDDVARRVYYRPDEKLVLGYAF